MRHNATHYKNFAHRGDLRLLQEPLTALFCSNRCAGDLILKSYDLARAMRDAGVPTIGGFQTPMEEGVPASAAAGKPARRRLPRPAASTGCASPASGVPLSTTAACCSCPPSPPRPAGPTAERAARRNDLVASLASRVFTAHAAPGSKTEAFARRLAASGKPLLTLEQPGQREPGGDGSGGPRPGARPGGARLSWLAGALQPFAFLKRQPYRMLP